MKKEKDEDEKTKTIKSRKRPKKRIRNCFKGNIKQFKLLFLLNI